MTIEWIEWRGGDCPVEPSANVRLRMRHLLYPNDRHGAEVPGVYRAGDIARWSHEGNAGDIIAYQVIE